MDRCVDRSPNRNYRFSVGYPVVYLGVKHGTGTIRIGLWLIGDHCGFDVLDLLDQHNYYFLRSSQRSDRIEMGKTVNSRVIL